MCSLWKFCHPSYEHRVGGRSRLVGGSVLIFGAARFWAYDRRRVVGGDLESLLMECIAQLGGAEYFGSGAQLPERPPRVSEVLKGQFHSKPAVWVGRLCDDREGGSGEFFATGRIEPGQHDKLRFSGTEPRTAGLPEFGERRRSSSRFRRLPSADGRALYERARDDSKTPLQIQVDLQRDLREIRTMGDEVPDVPYSRTRTSTSRPPRPAS